MTWKVLVLALVHTIKLLLKSKTDEVNNKNIGIPVGRLPVILTTRENSVYLHKNIEIK